MTFRAVGILKSVALIAAEDTRNTQKLLNHFEIKTKQISFHEHNSTERIPQLIAKLQQGEDIAQVSDAGMPSISDPGQDLVAEAVRLGLTVVPLPGANAALTALIASGITPQPFYFYGFLNRKKSEQKQEIQELVQRPETLIFYEAPHRLKETLKALLNGFGDRQVALCRELTKRHEEFIRGSLSEVLDWATSSEIRGEFVIVLAGNDHPEETEMATIDLSISVPEHVQQLIDEGARTNDAIKQVAKLRNLKRQDVYNEFHGI
ncbi:16S rRNA methyltransferase [Secundilactobacillus oryzae JCM 18671]|uniref:16S rRNA methyltransferase n=2 Tax=Secundilactobacillus oryzae TaxID=1202668 RepID=A0A081BK11_9LACO|nr:16S rRNA methyltransferase [Secundilactobacillus oryzae JCM 18671]